MQGSYEIMRLKWDLDIGCYYNLWLSPYMQDAYLDVSFLTRQLRQQRFILQALRNFAGLFQTMSGALAAHGAYFVATSVGSPRVWSNSILSIKWGSRVRGDKCSTRLARPSIRCTEARA